MLWKQKKRQYKRAYVLHETPNRVMICRVLNEYNNLDEANEDLVKLLTGKITEEDLLKNFGKKPVI